MTSYFPYDAAGRLCYWAKDHTQEYQYAEDSILKTSFTGGVRWQPPVRFTDTLTLRGVTGGKFIVRALTTGFEYVVFPVDFIDMCYQKIENGQITGTWEPIKRGNYGIRLVKGS